MKYTKEQVDVMIKAACEKQKEIDYNFFINELHLLIEHFEQTKPKTFE